MTRWIATAIAATLLAGCGQVIPDWYKPACNKRTADGGRQFCAEGSGATGDDALQAARARALRDAAEYLGSEVKSDITLSAKCVGLVKGSAEESVCLEEISNDIKVGSKAIEVREARIIREKVAPGDAGKQAWVTVKVPGDEWARLWRRARNMTFVSISCSDDAGKPCPRSVLDGLVDATGRCGMNAAGKPRIADKAGDRKALLKDALGREAAWLLELDVRTRSVAVEDEVHYVAAAGNWQLVDTVDGKAIAAREVPEARGAHLQPGPAARKALAKWTESLSIRSCGLSAAAGSLCCASEKR